MPQNTKANVKTTILFMVAPPCRKRLAFGINPYQKTCFAVQRPRSTSDVGTLAEQVFEGCAQVGFFVAVLDDDRRVEAEAPLCAFAAGDGAGAGNDDGVGRDDERKLFGGADYGAVDEIEDGSAAGEDGSR